MRVIVETNSRVRVRTRTRVRRAAVRLLRFLAGAPDTTPGEAIVVRRVSRVGTVVRAVVPDPLIENRQARAMATGLVVGVVHVAFALVNVVMGLLAQSVWVLSVGIVIAGLNAGKSYLASGALMSVTLDRRVESVDSLRRCRRAGTVLALAVPLIDTSFAFIRRILRGQSPFTPDRGHFHHRLLDMGMSQKQAVSILYTVSIILGVSAVVLATTGEFKILILVVGFCIAAACGLHIAEKNHNHHEAAQPHTEHDDGKN